MWTWETGMLAEVQTEAMGGCVGGWWREESWDRAVPWVPKVRWVVPPEQSVGAVRPPRRQVWALDGGTAPG